MNLDKKFFIGVLVIFVVSMLLGFVVHALILAGDYEKLTNVMRPVEEQEQLFMFMLVAHVFIAVGFTWLYRQGHVTGKPWLGQGVRFGIGFAVASAIPIYLIYHSVAQFPLDLALKQSALETASAVVLGVTAAFTQK